MDSRSAKRSTATVLLAMAGWATTLGLAGCGGSGGDPSEQIGSLRLIGSQAISTDTVFGGVKFGGISGLDRASDGSYWAISDDRGEQGTPRFYNLSIQFDDQAFRGVSIRSMVSLQGRDGQVLPRTRTVDPESIRVAPNGNLFVSSEGNFSTKAAELHQPFVREIRTDGSFVREFQTPAAFDYVDNATTGGSSNAMFESLAVTPDGRLFTANEDALIQDRGAAQGDTGNVVRFVQLDLKTGKSGPQYAYPLTKTSSAGSFGLTEILAVSDHEFLALERSYVGGVGNTIRIVKTRIDPGTTDVSNIPSLAGARYQPMSREVLLEMPPVYQGVKMDNVEAMTWGPRLLNGNRTLVLAADNNFSSTQTTLFLAFEVRAQ